MNTKLSVDALFLHSQAVSGYEKVGFSGCAIEKKCSILFQGPCSGDLNLL
jgi:hypothetical protein